MVSDNNYINLYMIEYNVIYLCELAHYTLTWLNLVNLMPKKSKQKCKKNWRIISAWSHLIACKENLYGSDWIEKCVHEHKISVWICTMTSIVVESFWFNCYMKCSNVFKLEFTFVVKVGIIDHFGNDLVRGERIKAKVKWMWNFE